MIIKTLYRFIREDGGVTVSLNKPDGEYTTLSRLIADEGKILVKGDIETYCIDTDNVNEWQEITELTKEEYIEELENEIELILAGVIEWRKN